MPLKRSKTPKRKSSSPKRKATSPKRRSPSPKRKGASPKRRMTIGGVLSPWGDASQPTAPTKPTRSLHEPIDKLAAHHTRSLLEHKHRSLSKTRKSSHKKDLVLHHAEHPSHKPMLQTATQIKAAEKAAKKKEEARLREAEWAMERARMEDERMYVS